MPFFLSYTTKALAMITRRAAAGRMVPYVVACFLPLSPSSARCDERLQTAANFEVEEATIAAAHRALQSGELTCRRLVQMYLSRIKAYDQSTGLNAIVVVNPRALERADELDREFKRTGKLRRLHGVPLIVKDNYDTKDLQTAAGSQALKGSLPPDDAYQVRVLREAGAIVLAKSNMAEWAFSPFHTVSSIAGTTRNPYALDRVPAGSSGGTAAAVAANLGMAGLGTDTGNSIRGPSSHTALVGIRSTLGLTSRDGIVPLFLRNDVGGPMARTVEDAVRVLQVIAGYDPADPVTRKSKSRIPASYTQFLDRNGLQGARIGVLRVLSDTDSTDPRVKALFEQAIRDLRAQGATVIDPFVIPRFSQLRRDLWRDTFRHDISQYLASLGPQAPLKSLEEIVESGLYHESVARRLRRALRAPLPKDLANPFSADPQDDPRRAALLDAVLAAMQRHRLDAFIYPTWNNPPRQVDDLSSPHGNNSPHIPPHTGQPALTVPMGFVGDNLPAGLQLVGRPLAESTLIKLAYAYEQATRHRRPPIFPPRK